MKTKAAVAYAASKPLEIIVIGGAGAGDLMHSGESIRRVVGF